MNFIILISDCSIGAKKNLKTYEDYSKKSKVKIN